LAWFEVNAGGHLTVATALTIGDAAASGNNSATVDGTGATLTSPTITAGNFGSNNSLTVSSGGSITSSSLTLGASASSANNSLTVNGGGSTFAATGNITVGNAGGGTLGILNGGNLSAGTILIASQTGSTGTVNIGTHGGNTTGGTLSAAIDFGGGNGMVNFNQGGNFTFAGNFTGGANTYPYRSLIQQLGSGTTTLTGTGSDACAAVIAEAGRPVFDGAVFDIGIDLISGDAQSGATVELKTTPSRRFKGPPLDMGRM